MKKQRRKSALTNSIPAENDERELHYEIGCIFPTETIKSLPGLGEILLKIHHRLISEGWIIKDGVFIPPQEGRGTVKIKKPYNKT